MAPKAPLPPVTMHDLRVEAWEWLKLVPPGALKGLTDTLPQSVALIFIGELGVGALAALSIARYVDVLRLLRAVGGPFVCAEHTSGQRRRRRLRCGDTRLVHHFSRGEHGGIR